MPATLEDIDVLKERLQSLLPMKKEYQERLDKKFRLEFNYNSNHIEGNTLTYGETELLLIFGETKGNHDKREYDEMEAHDVAYERIKAWAHDERPLSEMDIKNLNETILVKPFWKDAVTPDGQPTRRLIKIGDYKEYPNSVKLPNGETFHYASPTDTPIQMGELIQWYRDEEEKKELHPVVLAAILHYRFVRIHPFDDGNGRISRLLVNYVLLRNGYPPAVIKSSDKKNYLHALHQADAGFLDKFVEYIIRQVKWSLEISIQAATGDSIDERGDLDKKLQILKKKLNKNEEVKIEKNTESLIDCFQNNIKPFLETVLNTLNKFDNLFRSKNVNISVFGGSKAIQCHSISDIEKALRNTVTDAIAITYSLGNLRDKIGGNGFLVNFVINFYQLVYSVKILEPQFEIEKLYHEFLSVEEIQNIAEKIGNTLYEKIQMALTK